ncbi:DUF192 domain-containing protein [Pusillimonas caeni]|nr:DUF192 domain-containing protein [Pusillimonas caeni]
MFKHLIVKRPFGLFFFAFQGGVGRPATRRHTRARQAACAAACLVAGLMTSLVPSPAPAQARLLPTASLSLGAATAHVEIAATPEVRNRGLMFRESLPPDHGMLFVFEQETAQCFWMKNTPLPLSIAFIDARGRIINMRDMQPHSEATHCPAGPMRYALEMPRGWFLQYGIEPGQQVEGLPSP